MLDKVMEYLCGRMEQDTKEHGMKICFMEMELFILILVLSTKGHSTKVKLMATEYKNIKMESYLKGNLEKAKNTE